MLSIELKSSQSSRSKFLTTHLLLQYIIINRDLPNREKIAIICTNFHASDYIIVLHFRLNNGQCFDVLSIILHGFKKAYILAREPSTANEEIKSGLRWTHQNQCLVSDIAPLPLQWWIRRSNWSFDFAVHDYVHKSACHYHSCKILTYPVVSSYRSLQQNS